MEFVGTVEVERERKERRRRDLFWFQSRVNGRSFLPPGKSRVVVVSGEEA